MKLVYPRQALENVNPNDGGLGNSVYPEQKLQLSHGTDSWQCLVPMSFRWYLDALGLR